MIFGVAWAVWLTWLVALLFFVNGVANLFNPKPFRESFERWNFPPWFHLFNGAVQIVTGVLLAMPATRGFGFALGLLVCLAVYATLIRVRELSHAGPVTVLTGLTLLAAWGLWGF